MRRGEFDDLIAFIAIADRLSFRAAASQLGVTPSAISHTMRQLEERLGTRLLNRTTHSVSLTDAGFRLLGRLRPAVDQVGEALEDLNRERSRPFGHLRIYATYMSAVAVVTPVWQRFLSTYPDVRLEVEVGETPIDIVAKGFDAGIGPQDRATADMIAARVMGPMKVAVVGAPSYFARHPKIPLIPEDLTLHHCVQYRRGGDNVVLEWPFERDGETHKISVDGRIMVNAMNLAVRAAVDGLGIAYSFDASVEPFLRSGQLIRVLDDWSPSFNGLFLYHPSHRQVPAALRAFIDLIRAGRDTAPLTCSVRNPFIAN